MSGAGILAVRDVRHEAGGRTILEIPELFVRDNVVLAVVGPNGAGKSTLLRILSGLQRPTEGTLMFAGMMGAAASAALRLRSAFVFQAPYLWSGTVRRNLELGLRLRAVDVAGRDARVADIASQLGLEPLLARDAATLSGGEAQRVALARALVLDPDVLFLDEPSSSLDAEAHAALREDIDRVARTRAGAVVLATHERPDAFYLADSIAVLRDGRLVQSGTPSELFENPADPFIAGITGAELAMRGVVTDVNGEILAVRVGSHEMQVVGRADVGRAVKVSYRPEDLFLSRAQPEEGSARNRFPARITEVRSLGALVRVRLAGPAEFVAIVTRASAEELSLGAGGEVWVQIKATALHAFAI